VQMLFRMCRHADASSGLATVATDVFVAT
jgi:hypothetical protein